MDTENDIVPILYNGPSHLSDTEIGIQYWEL